MNKEDILGVEWFSGRDTIGIVAFKTIGGWRAVIGKGSGFDEQSDTINIADWGSKVQKHIAIACFPDLNSNEFVF